MQKFFQLEVSLVSFSTRFVSSYFVRIIQTKTRNSKKIIVYRKKQFFAIKLVRGFLPFYQTDVRGRVLYVLFVLCIFQRQKPRRRQTRTCV